MSVPAAPAPDPVQPPPAADPLRRDEPGAAAASGPVEDFETWRMRRQAEQVGAAAEAVGAEPFPWRKYPWLAQLLGVPDPARAGQR